MKPERAGFAFVLDATAPLNEIQAVRPAGIGNFHLVVEPIDDGRELDTQLAHASSCYRGALLLIAGTPEEHLVTNIALHLPDVGRVRFENIDGIKIDLVLVLLGELIQGGNLPPKGRSSVTAKDQHDWFISPKGRQLYRRFGAKSLYLEAGSHVSDG
jgi:hypothetical protein